MNNYRIITLRERPELVAIENDDCSILCNVTGIAILHNDFKNFDIIISSYFPLLLNQPATRFVAYILFHRALPPDIQLPFSPLRQHRTIPA